MSVHRSLATKSSLARSRNVLTRYERILQLRKGGKWADDGSPYGLPKVRVPRSKQRGKAKKKDEAAAAPGVAAPAAGAAPAAAAPADKKAAGKGSEKKAPEKKSDKK